MRLTAPAMPAEVYHAVVLERQRLLRAKYEDGVSPADERRLRFYEWQISVTEDRAFAPGLDELEGFVASFERAAGEIARGTGRYRGYGAAAHK